MKTVFKFTILFFLFSTPFYSFSQTTHYFKEKFSTPEMQNGEIGYHYYRYQHDTILHGKFSLQLTSNFFLDSNTTEYTTTEYTGSYFQNTLNGPWNYSKKKLIPGKKGTIKNHEVSFPSNGIEKSISAFFTKGKPNGKWDKCTYQITNGAISDTLFFSRAFFKNGVFSGNIQAYAHSNQQKLTGEFTTEGYVNNKWSITGIHDSVLYSDHRTYKNNFLHELLLISNLDTIAKLDFSGVADSIETVRYNDSFGNIVFINLICSNPSPKALTIIESDNQFVSKSILGFHRVDSNLIWKSVPRGFSFPSPLLKVKTYPFSNLEKEDLNTLRREIDSLNIFLQAILSDPQLILSKYISKEMGVYYTVLNTYEMALIKADSICRILENPFFKYVNRKKYFSEYKSPFSYPQFISFEFEDSIVSEKYNFPDTKITGNKLIEDLKNHILNISSDVSLINSKRKDVQDKIRFQKTLQQLEMELLRSNKKVRSLYKDTQNPDYNKYHETTQPKIISFLDQSIDDYAHLDETQKTKKGKELIKCYQDLELLFSTLSTIPEQTEKIDKAYTQSVFNPYTYTYMNERKKEKLYNAYYHVIFPYLIKEISDETDCAKITLQTNNFNKLFDHMFKFLETDTRKIERKIKKSDDVKKLIGKLNLDLVIN